VFREVDSLLDLRQEGSSVSLLKDQVEILGVLKEVLQLIDLQLSTAEIVEFDFLQDFCSRESWSFLADDLDCELVAGKLEDARLDTSVAALTQNFTLQTVSFLETGGRKSGMQMKQKKLSNLIFKSVFVISRIIFLII